jgi:hypothetical protein
MAGCSCGCVRCGGLAQDVSIYGLVDPRTGVVRYVGRSVDVAQRVRDHVGDRRDGSARGEWLSELVAEGLRPGVVVFETVAAEDGPVAEQRWMDAHDSLLNLVAARSSTRVFSVRLPLEMVEWIDSYAAARGWSRTDVMRTALANLRDDASRGVVEVDRAAC